MRDKDSGLGERSDLPPLPAAIKQPDYTEEQSAAAFLVGRLRFISLTISDPEYWWFGFRPEGSSLADRAHEATGHFQELTDVVAECIIVARRLSSGRQQRRALAALYFLQDDLNADAVGLFVKSALEQELFGEVLDIYYDICRRNAGHCAVRFRWIAAELCAWLDTQGKKPPAPESRPPIVRDKLLDERDQWIYDECCKGTAYDAIALQLKKRPENWPALESPQGVRIAAIRYARRKGLPSIPRRMDY